jgi:hypothetical protein
MKTSATILAVVFIVCIGMPMLANAASWSPLQEEREERYDKAARGILEKDSVVCLFQSGTADVKKEIRINDILTVYRENQNHQLKEVGKIKIRSYVGEDYLKGEVVEGELMPGDIAKKGEVASLVIFSSDKCK